MSTWYQQELACGECHHVFAATFARGLHVRRIPEVRAQILAGELHHIRCPACHGIVDAHRELAYTDFAQHHWVQVSTPGAVAEWAAVEREALATFDRYMVGGPPAVAHLARTFQVRVVFDLDELREKLALWDAGLDDALVEIAKLVCLRERTEIAGPGRCLRIRRISDEEIAVAVVARPQPRVDLARFAIPRTLLATIAGERSAWEARMPELFQRGFVALDRYLR